MRSNAVDAALRARAAEVIPGGMYGHESVGMLPAEFPQFFARAQGARLWDADGHEYVDLMCAYGPNLLGYADPEIDAAYVDQLARGDTMTGPSPKMVELAEALVRQVAHARWAMFCRNGTDATSMAVRVARAQTGRRTILVARGAYHGSDARFTPVPTGSLPEDRAHVASFVHGDVASLHAAAKAAEGDLAGVLVSPFRHDAFVDQTMPDRAFAQAVREVCDRGGGLLILDEVRAGFRLSRSGSWTSLGVEPDLSAWGKCLANGHALSALLGGEVARDAATRVYATGSFWFSAAPMAAALATLARIRDTDYLERIERAGARLREGLARAAADSGYVLRQTGPVQMPQLLLDDDPDFRRGFAFAEEMIGRGVYVHPWHNNFVCAVLTDGDVDTVAAAASDAFAAVRAREGTLVPHARLAARLAR
ncbi:MAG: aminotransferase class III-fold pyridoxal phosphate-dependent enzyme [Burkholderiaceae bacterium]|jgi:glutamate-1-semialdehyde 2,1-aminomutase|nr:aminotransferase class III-fold pyridoxal phosphate-dependent enzyme [Burkholderiales bacterium]MCZ8101290.1 aminotransferase class III-fold pyridoxal phosphate-dependent enzyme [Burkholderiales bacterium]MCZ8341296.1 aminotransferase class III-fold pyridoxal phosphate-dependent enzyme [Burkholderiaceae bacterium]